jgi:hypothetical protein
LVRYCGISDPPHGSCYKVGGASAGCSALLGSGFPERRCMPDRSDCLGSLHLERVVSPVYGLHGLAMGSRDDGRHMRTYEWHLLPARDGPARQVAHEWQVANAPDGACGPNSPHPSGFLL